MGGERLCGRWGGDGVGGGGCGLHEGGKTWEGGISITETMAHFSLLAVFLPFPISLSRPLALLKIPTSQPAPPQLRLIRPFLPPTP